MTQTERTLWFLGRKVNGLLPATLRPTRAELQHAANVLMISLAQARRAWTYYTYGP